MSALVRLYPRSWRARYEDEFLGLLEARHLAGVGQDPLGGRDPLGAEHVGLALDQHHLVAVADQLLGDGAANIAGSGDRDPHLSDPPRVPSW